jgi:hypothetical protein
MSEDKHIDSVSQTFKYSTEQFDKNILFIASGAFVVSFAFIKDIIPNLKEASNKEYLIYSWYIFAGIIFVSLVSHFISMLLGKWAMDNQHLGDDEYNSKLTGWNWLIRILNGLMILAILAGALSLIYFINHNINKT